MKGAAPHQTGRDHGGGRRGGHQLEVLVVRRSVSNLGVLNVIEGAHGAVVECRAEEQHNQAEQLEPTRGHPFLSQTCKEEHITHKSTTH